MVVAIEKRLVQQSLQCSYYDKFAKTYNIEKGIIGNTLIKYISITLTTSLYFIHRNKHLFFFLERTLSIGCKDPFSHCVLLLSPNLHHVGELKSDFFSFKRHGLSRCYISCGPPQFKCPSIPHAWGSGNGDLEGKTKPIAIRSVLTTLTHMHTD